MLERIIVSMVLIITLQGADFGVYSYNEVTQTADYANDSGVTVDMIKEVTVEKQNGQNVQYLVCFRLNDIGAERNSAFSKKYVGKRIAIMVNGMVVSSPKIIVGSRDDFAIQMDKFEWGEDFRTVFKDKLRVIE